MGVFDTLLKQVIANGAAVFASWILQADVDAIEPVSVELPGEALRADAVFRARRADGLECIVQSFRVAAAGRQCRGVCSTTLPGSPNSIGCLCGVR